MNRKKFSFFYFLAVICLSVVMVSCGNDDEGDEPGTGDTDTYGALKSVEYTYSLDLKGDFDLVYNKSIQATIDGEVTSDKMDGLTFTKVYNSPSSNNASTAEFVLVLEDNGKDLPEGVEKCDFYALPKLEIKAVYEKQTVSRTFEPAISSTGDNWIYTKGVDMNMVLSSGKTACESVMSNFPKKMKVSVNIDNSQIHVNIGTGLLSN
ncbi:MAG: hypothetical protein ACI4AK_09780 [Lepagella sp.]